MKPLLIVKTGSTFPALAARQGDFEDWIGRVAQGMSLPISVLAAQTAEILPDLKDYSGMVITGSHAMVSAREPWSERLVPWLQQAVKQELPLLGICYGHQLLAHALGGLVDYHPAGIEIGTVMVEKRAAADADPLFGALPGVFPAQVVHRQRVIRLPEGAVVLAANDFESHHAFRVGRCAWGVQFHPEFDADAMRGYLEQLAGVLSGEGVDADAKRAGVRDTPDAARVLAAFCQQLLASAH